MPFRIESQFYMILLYLLEVLQIFPLFFFFYKKEVKRENFNFRYWKLEIQFVESEKFS